jgi:hypothetical protein
MIGDERETEEGKENVKAGDDGVHCGDWREITTQ